MGYGGVSAAMGMGGDPRATLSMQLVAMFQGSPDPFAAAAQYVYTLGASGGAALGGGAMTGMTGMTGVGGYSAYGALAGFGGSDMNGKRARMAPKAGDGGNWECSCGNVNFPFRSACNRCSKEKETATPPALN